MAKIFCTIGKNFITKGLQAMAISVKKKPKSYDTQVLSNTIFYMERFMRNLVYSQKTEVKKTPLLHDNAITILDFLIENGSAQAYVLRETII